MTVGGRVGSGVNVTVGSGVLVALAVADGGGVSEGMLVAVAAASPGALQLVSRESKSRITTRSIWFK
jgi:hypothetical protein